MNDGGPAACGQYRTSSVTPSSSCIRANAESLSCVVLVPSAISGRHAMPSSVQPSFAPERDSGNGPGRFRSAFAAGPLVIDIEIAIDGSEVGATLVALRTVTLHGQHDTISHTGRNVGVPTRP